MRAITVMYDSLNRNYLSPYEGKCDTPNFDRLAKKCVTFDNFYVGSMPCMPARREIQTGRYNFLHRSWGPLEPYDVSAIELLSKSGINTHSISDHAHYWQEGGLNYHNRFSSYEFIRGQEGDFWKGDNIGYQGFRDIKSQDIINRKHIEKESDFPHVKCFNSAMEFLQNNKNEDNWFLHLEYFDPHEPFFSPERFKKMVSDSIDDIDWPAYGEVEDKDELIKVINNYKALLLMCDYYLGKLLDFMDENDMWKDTMLIVNTDHGYLLGEHNFYAKNIMPIYNEIANIPFFIWDPKSSKNNIRSKNLCQTIDIPATLLDYFGIKKPYQMQGNSILNAVRRNENVRDFALFGYFGMHVNITDGKYVYMRSAKGKDCALNNYTLMPTHIYTPFSFEELKNAKFEETSFAFANNLPMLKVPSMQETAPPNSCYFYNSHLKFGDLLFDLEKDPKQMNPITDATIEEYLKLNMIKLMEQTEAPKEQYKRLGLD